MTADGRPTKQIIDRIQGAIFAKAYQNDKLLKLSIEEPDPEIRNVLTALNAAAPDFIAMRYLSGEAHKQTAESVAGGVEMNSNLDEQALSALVDAATIVRSAKATGQNINEYLSQGALFGDNDPSASALAKFIADNNRSAKRMGEAFKLLAAEINAELTHQGQAAGDMFGAPPLDLIMVLARVSEKMQDQYGEAAGMSLSMFESLQSAIQAAVEHINTDPTEAQKLSGNYAKGHVDFYGLPLTLENPKGSMRCGVDCNGKAWESTMQHHYGYIKRTTGADGDHVDVFLGDELDSDRVFIVNQVTPDTGLFDEHKVMLGFTDKDAAHAAYLSNYETGWNAAESVHELSLDDFKTWLSDGDNTSQYEPVQMLESVSDVDWVVAGVMTTNKLNELLDIFDVSTGLPTAFNRDVDELHQMVKGLSIMTIDASVFFEQKLDELLNEKTVSNAIKRIKDIKLMSETAKADLMASVSDAVVRIKKTPDKYRSINYEVFSAFYDNNWKEGGFVHKATNTVLAMFNTSCREAMNADVISGIGPVRDVLNQCIEQSPVSKRDAENRTKQTQIRVTSARLASNYEMSQMKADMAEFFRLSSGAMQGIELVYKKKRASANRRDGTLNVGGALNRSTLWHEMGHFVEFYNPWVLREAKALLKRRYQGITSNKPVEALAVMCNSTGYDRNERAINDGFFHPYVGKIYGSWPDVDSTEVISMGFECLSSDKGIAELAKKDPEHLALMLAIVKKLGVDGLAKAEAWK